MLRLPSQKYSAVTHILFVMKWMFLIFLAGNNAIAYSLCDHIIHMCRWLGNKGTYFLLFIVCHKKAVREVIMCFTHFLKGFEMRYLIIKLLSDTHCLLVKNVLRQIYQNRCSATYCLLSMRWDVDETNTTSALLLTDCLPCDHLVSWQNNITHNLLAMRQDEATWK